MKRFHQTIILTLCLVSLVGCKATSHSLSVIGRIDTGPVLRVCGAPRATIDFSYQLEKTTAPEAE